MPSLPMIFTFEAFMVKMPSVEICPVFPFESRPIVPVVDTVTIMSVPGRIRIIGISGIVSLIQAHADVDLGISRISCQACGDDQKKNK